MSAIVKLTKEVMRNHNVLSIAFQANVSSFESATKLLSKALPGTYITFFIHTQNYCAAVAKDGSIIFNPFTWLASGEFMNGSGSPYANAEALLDHLVDGQKPVALYSN